MGLFDKNDDKKKNQQNFGLFSFINEQNSNDDNKDENDEVYNNLEDWQKEEVKKGNQDPWDFEEEDRDDDNYYSEDDD